MYSNFTVNSKSSLKRFAHSRRFQLALEILNPKDGEAVLDFGTGDGFFLMLLENHHPGLRIVGYEPHDQMFEELKTCMAQFEGRGKIEITNELSTRKAHSFDCVTCLEVLEHFSEANQKVLLNDIKHLIKTGGRLVVSVPLEFGLSALVKNIVRLILKEETDVINLRNMIDSFLGRPIDRGHRNFIGSHVGFYSFDLERVLQEEGLIIREKQYSPLPFLGKLFNSQVFYSLGIAD